MNTGEPGLRAIGAVFPSEATFRALQQPKGALRYTPPIPGAAIPTVLLRSPRRARPVLV
jgi:hypothetical protein